MPKLKKNLYYDEKCTKRPYSVAINVNKERVCQSFATRGEAEEFLERLQRENSNAKKIQKFTSDKYIQTKAHPCIWKHKYNDTYAVVAHVSIKATSEAMALRKLKVLQEQSEFIITGLSEWKTPGNKPGSNPFGNANIKEDEK